jgi:hypothetical protein
VEVVECSAMVEKGWPPGPKWPSVRSWTGAGRRAEREQKGGEPSYLVELCHTFETLICCGIMHGYNVFCIWGGGGA